MCGHWAGYRGYDDDKRAPSTPRTELAIWGRWEASFGFTRV